MSIRSAFSPGDEVLDRWTNLYALVVAGAQAKDHITILTPTHDGFITAVAVPKRNLTVTRKAGRYDPQTAFPGQRERN